MTRILFVFLVFAAFACEKDNCDVDCDAALIPTAKFQYSKFRCDNGIFQCVQFQNVSENINGSTKYNWTFGDGEGSNEENPNHSYQHNGEFNVVLKVTNCNGTASFYTETIDISTN